MTNRRLIAFNISADIIKMQTLIFNKMRFLMQETIITKCSKYFIIHFNNCPFKDIAFSP